MTYRGQVKGAVIVFDPSIPIPEGAEVEFEFVVRSTETSPNGEHPRPEGTEEAGKKDHPVPVTDRPPDDVPLDFEGRPIDPAFLIGDWAIDTGIPDLGKNLDHYLYGHPKVEDEQ